MMSKSTFEDWPLLERLTNDEFFNILQHLSLDQYVLTQVFIPKKKWIPLLDANLHTLQIKCGVCNKQVRFEDIRRHVVLKDHLILLRSTVKQFYHPFYTYGKIDIKLSRGEVVSPDLRKSALREVNSQTECFKKEYIFAKQFSDLADRRSQGIEEEELIQSYLKKNIVNPDDMIVIVNLPFEHISKLLFCIVNNDRQNVISYKNLTKKTTFHCNICTINCCGIESLNSHLYGHSHKLMQLELSALYYEDSSRVNKNCCIQFGNTFSFSIKNNVKNLKNFSRYIDPDYWISKVSYEIASKVKPLNDHALQMLQISEKSIDQSQMNRKWENIESFGLKDVLGHLGVEYVLKIVKHENDKEAKYECGLCEFVADEKKMQRHLLYYDHKKKYLDLHYSDTVKIYESLIGHVGYKQFRAVMNEVVHKVAIEIENHHSRSLPYKVLLADYNDRRPVLIAEVYSLLHASQLRGPSFSNILSKEDINYFKNFATQLGRKTYKYPEYVLFTEAPKTKVYLNLINHDPVIRLKEYNAKLNKNVQLRADSPTRDHLHNFTRKYDSHPERSDVAARDHCVSSRPTIYGRTRTSPQSVEGALYAKNQNIWDIYRHEISLAANEIEIAYDNYRINPESHPLYEDEWNNFWQRRKKEIEREGYDHHSYNFQPEWVQYFKQRIEVLFGVALHKSQINIRRKLDIPLDVEEDYIRPAEVLSEYGKGGNGSVEEDNSGFKENKRQCFPTLTNWDQQNKKVCLEQKPEDFKTKNPQIIVSKLNDNHSNVIHVLRLITALEEHLGSLGAKVMNLLSNALQLEKYYSGNNNEFEARVLTIENCNLLETAMEKLKGILFAGLLDEKKINGFNRVIIYTSNLLKYAEAMGWRRENSTLKKNASSGRPRVIQDQSFDIRYGNQAAYGKTLSDTLMDLAKTTQPNKQQRYLTKETFGNHSKEQLNQPNCPPPPNIKETAISMNSFAGFKGQLAHSSGLASFDTNLSLDKAYITQKIRRELPFEQEIGQLHGETNSVGNNIYNNSFKNNNETRTNINSRTGNGSSLQF